VVGLIDGVLIGRWNGVTNLLEPGSSQLVPAMLGIGLISAVGTGMGAGFTYWLAGAPGIVTLAETVRWSWSRVQKRLALVLGVGLSCGLILGLVWGLVGGNQWLGLIDGLAVDLVAGLMLGLVLGLVSDEIETKQVPNQGIRRSARTASRVGCVVWLVAGVSIGLAVALTSIIIIGPEAFESTQQLLDVIWSVTNWGIWALSLGWGAGVLYGGLACLRHLLLRFMLWRSGGMPWKYAHFLDYAAERIFLYKVGGGYIFVHRLLLEYFAALDNAPATATPPISSMETPPAL
jgi:hypothetical protein